MSLTFYAHPFSSYGQKVLVALYENDTPFEWRMLSPDHPQVLKEWADLWPLKRMPVPPVICSRRRRGASVSSAVPARRARPRLTPTGDRP